jgi:hypothetical protein
VERSILPWPLVTKPFLLAQNVPVSTSPRDARPPTPRSPTFLDILDISETPRRRRLRVGIGPVASRLALSWPDLLGAVAGPIKEATSHCLLWSSGSGAGSGVTSTICRSTRPSPAGWFPVVCLHRDRSPQPSSACRALAVPPPGLVPEQLSDRLQAGEPCFARLIGFLLRVLALYPPASNAHVNIIAAIRLTLSFL